MIRLIRFILLMLSMLLTLSIELMLGIPITNINAIDFHIAIGIMNNTNHIHTYIIEKVKNRLLNSKENASEIAYVLGFEYPQYFSMIFKKKTTMSPNEFKQSLN